MLTRTELFIRMTTRQVCTVIVGLIFTRTCVAQTFVSNVVFTSSTKPPTDVQGHSLSTANSVMTNSNSDSRWALTGNNLNNAGYLQTGFVACSNPGTLVGYGYFVSGGMNGGFYLTRIGIPSTHYLCVTSPTANTCGYTYMSSQPIKMSVYFNVASPNSVIYNSAVELSLGTWYHFASVLDTSSSTVSLYIDGNMDGSVSYTGTANFGGSAVFQYQAYPGAWHAAHRHVKKKSYTDHVRFTFRRLTDGRLGHVRFGAVCLASVQRVRVRLSLGTQSSAADAKCENRFHAHRRRSH